MGNALLFISKFVCIQNAFTIKSNYIDSMNHSSYNLLDKNTTNKQKIETEISNFIAVNFVNILLESFSEEKKLKLIKNFKFFCF